MLEELPRIKEKPQPLTPIAPPAKPRKSFGGLWRVARRMGVGIATFVLLNLLVLQLEPYFLNVVSYEQTHAAEKILLYQQQPAPDIIFMGSSRVENGLDPAVVEQTIAEETKIKPRTLNLGVPNGNLQLSYLMLKNIIQDKKLPSVIVYGLAELELDNRVENANYFQKLTSEVPNSEVLFRQSDVGRYGGDQLDQKAIFMVNQLVPLIRDQKLIMKALDIQFNSQNINHADYQKQTKLPQNGYLAYISSLQSPELQNNAEFYKKQLPDFQPQSSDMQFFKDFVDLAKAKGIKVVLVNMPVSAVHEGFWQDDSKIERYRETVKNLASENGVPLLDVYRDANLFPPTSFFDSNHLRTEGATALSQMLAKNYLAGYFNTPEKPKASFYKSKLTDLNVSPRLPDKVSTTGSVNIQNLSPYTWPNFGNNSVRLTYHWLKPDGTVYLYEGVRTNFSYSLRPGESQNVLFNFSTPDKPGQYILQVELVYDSVRWFSAAGGPTTQARIIVEP